jgi:hypothetical protein
MFQSRCASHTTTIFGQHALEKASSYQHQLNRLSGEDATRAISMDEEQILGEWPPLSFFAVSGHARMKTFLREIQGVHS